MIVEILTFRPAGGVDEAALLDADRRVQTEFCYQQPGFVRRTTARGDDGEWAVITLWGSIGEANGAAAAAGTDAACAAFRDSIEPASVITKQYTTLD